MPNKNLIIVESPNKIKSIQKYVGEGYETMASVGHIVYLPSSGEHRFGVDLETWTPRYKIDPEKTEIVSNLKKAAKKADIVYIATDPDREGEAIASNLVEFLNVADKYRRIKFNEITSSAVQAALSNPTELDEQLVKSQVARRILDRIIGYKLSELMKKKIANSPANPSAGRVQSIALKLTVEREAEIKAFIPVEYITLNAPIANYSEEVTAVYYNDAHEAAQSEWIFKDELAAIKDALKLELTVVDLNKSERSDAKKHPFKQSELFKKADTELNLSAASVQRAMQQLYEIGIISYPRTDSTRLAASFVTVAKEFIESTYGSEYVATTIKGEAGAQDAHEAIRPTDIALIPARLSAEHGFETGSPEYKTYKLIWTQTMQALMVPPRREITRYELTSNQHKFKMVASKFLFQGYRLLDEDKSEQKALPIFAIGTKLKVSEFKFEDHATQPPARYTDGSLIKKLDDIGVGRPSTFATTVRILKDRGYVDLNGKALVPTEFGTIIVDKLKEAFPEIMNEAYTAELELELDEIADGKYEYDAVLNKFWDVFQKDLVSATQELSITKVMPIYAGKKCPLCGEELLVRTNRKNGDKFFGCSAFPKCRHLESDPSQAKRNFFRKRAKGAAKK